MPFRLVWSEFETRLLKHFSFLKCVSVQAVNELGLKPDPLEDRHLFKKRSISCGHMTTRQLLPSECGLFTELNYLSRHTCACETQTYYIVCQISRQYQTLTCVSMFGWICSDWADWFWGTMGTEFSILTGKVELLLEAWSPETYQWKWEQWVQQPVPELSSTQRWRLLACNKSNTLFTFFSIVGKLIKAFWSFLFWQPASLISTLYSRRRADNQSLLERLRLAAQTGRTCWNWDTLLSEPGNVNRGLLVQCWLVVQQRNRSPRRRHLGETLKTKTIIATGVPL